jgi:hypothetical protein
MLETLEQACARMTPYLAVVAVGLALLNVIVICLVAMSPHLPVTRISYENAGAATQPGCKTTLGVGVAPTSGY